MTKHFENLRKNVEDIAVGRARYETIMFIVNYQSISNEDGEKFWSLSDEELKELRKTYLNTYQAKMDFFYDKDLPYMDMPDKQNPPSIL